MPSFLTEPEALLPYAEPGVDPGPDRQRRKLPDAVAYREALQHPEAHLGFPDLARGSSARGRDGLPLAYSGRFAVVFRVAAPDGSAWALRCFTSPDRLSERSLHWQGVARYADVLPTLLLPVRFLERGVRVDGAWYPAVAMPWASGEPLLVFVKRHLAVPGALTALAESLGRALARLEAAGVAHGDWQHDNLFVSENGRGVTLVDYDGFFTPDWATGAGQAIEIGHPNYQHPGRNAESIGVGIDRFAYRAMRAALLALARDASLWDRFGGDGESLLFSRQDYAAPHDSRLFAEVRRLAESDGGLADALAELETDCALPAPTVLPALTLRPEVGVWVRDRRVRVPVDNDDGTVPSCTRFRPYPERLGAMEAAGAGRRNVTAARAFLLAAALSISASAALTGWSFFTAVLAAACAHWFLFGYYLNWPRKRVWDALHQELGKLTVEVAGLEERKRAAFEGPVGPPTCCEAVVRERTRESLQRVSISRALAAPGIRRETVRLLRSVGIESARDLSDAGPLPAPLRGGAEAARLRLWCRETERSFAERHARNVSPERRRAARARALEQQIARRRRRMRELQSECSTIRGAGLHAYLAAILMGRA